jgi:hypothetical protein
MSLFDMFKDKVTELTGAGTVGGVVDGVIGGATDQADQFSQTAEGMQQRGQNLVENTETTATNTAADAVDKNVGE